ncbi:MAG TPA: RNA polymerase sigma factor RpoD/SigA [Candidatus Polarisedimenticolaceae bacterium]
MGIPIREREGGAEVLDPATERDLALRARSSREARDRLILANLHVVAHVAREYRGWSLAFEDLCHEGVLGLLEAVRRFEPSRGTRFSTYATWWVRKHVLAALHDHPAPLRVPDYQRRQERKVVRAERDLRTVLGRTPRRDEISAHMAIPLESIDRMMRERPTPVSLDAPRSDSDASTLIDRLVDASSPPPDTGLIAEESRRALLDAFARLPARHRFVIGRRLGIDGAPTLTLQEIGVLLEVSRERVRQVEREALARLRRQVTRSLHAARGA